MDEVPRQFGSRVPGQPYVLRPSAYVVLRDTAGRVALVRTPVGVFLPGGGQHPGESPEDAARREVAEECGLEIELTERLGVADQFAYSKEETAYFQKRSTFFGARRIGPTPQLERDHETAWLSDDAARRELSHESHGWAIGLERLRTP